MNKKSTSVTLTGGAGFNFEDYVAAYFMIHLLSNVPPIDTGFGVVVSVDFQVSESGWLLDDLLITGKGNEELLRRLSISVKRDKQVTKNEFPPHFVEAIWKQWLETQSNPFVKDQDLLCLAVGKMADTVKEAWDEMLSQALSTSPDRMAERLSPQSTSNSKIQKNIFNSLHCQKNLKQENNTEDVDTARLLKHVRLLHFDFQSSQSSDKKEGIKLCRDCLSSGSIDEAKELWDKLVEIAADLRTRGGTIDRTQLIKKLHKFKLTEFPDFRSDWNILQKVSEDGIAGVRTEIGHGVVISREAIINQINHKLNNLRIQVMLGESGSGKSALAKTIAGSRIYDKVIWFNNENLNGQGLHQVSRKLGLQHDLTKLLPAAGNLKALLVLDAVEKFSKDCLRNTAKLIDSLNLDEEGSRWFVLLTVQPLNWMNIQQELHLNGLKLSKEIVTMVELPDQQELTPVFHKLPTIKPLMLRPGLQRLLRNFKILDWIARALDNQQPALSYWVSESDLINWLWNSWVKTGKEQYVRAGLLKKIGEKEAQSFAGGVPLHDLTSDENRVLAELEGSQLLRVKEERVYFTHDLLGDWSRLHKLIGLNELERAETLKILAEIPRWHHAVRLYGLRILEQELDSTRWFKLYQQLSGASTHGSVAADIILEAVALSTNASILLECVWPHLSTENGVLLNKLIKRFRHVASFPDHIVQSSTNDDDLKIWFAASFRIPYWPYWGPMLTFLHSHAEEVKKIAFHSISELCLLWLSQIPVEISHGTAFPWRREAAELALLAAREVQGLKAEDVSFHDGHDDAPYEAFLYAAPEFPEKVSALALELAQRRPPAPEIQQRSEEIVRRRSEEHKKRLKEDTEYREQFEDRAKIPHIFSPGPRLAPWPDGPADRIDEAFRKACIKTKALYFLMKYRPEVAKEVLLALCIEPPRYQYYQNDPLKTFKFATSVDYEGNFFLHRPFLLFLQTSPIAAIEVIVKLVNFATERWLDLYRAHPGNGVDNDINEEQTIDLWIGDNKYKWIGNNQIFGWYRSYLISANYVVSVLMALEKWFYDEVDAGRDITKWVNKIFKESRSTAFVGVFVALAKKQPELLLNCLRPILSIWQIFSWDLQLIHSGWGIPLYGLNIGEKTFNMIKDWDQLPHRKIKILDQVIELMLSNHEFRIYLKKIKRKWRKALNHMNDRKDFELLIEYLNPDNYKPSNNKTNNTFLFEWPEHLRDYIKINAERSSYNMTIINFPIHCQQILDDNQPLDSENLEQHWEMLQDIADSFETQDQEAELHYNAVMSGIAVLVSLHSDWLRKEPEKEQWCKNQIQQIITKKHSIKQFNIPDSNLEINWLNFFGEIAVCYLVENTSDKQAKDFLFQSVFAPHYSPIKRVCKVSFQKRLKLGEEFRRILNLCKLWSGIRCAIIKCQQLNIQSVRLQEWPKEVYQSFKNCTLQVSPIPLCEIAAKSKDIIREAENEYSIEHREDPYASFIGAPLTPVQFEKIANRNHSGLDWQVLQAAYSWIPDLDEAANEDERKQWIAIQRELLELELTYLRNEERKPNGEIHGTPYEFEFWVFSLIARLIPKLKADEKPEEFWKPILDLGASAHYWIDRFLCSWFKEGLNVAASTQVFADHWCSMILYALSSPLWRNDDSVPCYHRLTELHIQLMGLGFCAEVIGQQEYSDMITELIPLYEKWAGEWLNKIITAKAFAAFILKPAAKQMIIPGIKWLNKGINQIHLSQWKFYSLSESLLSVLWSCWKKYRPEVESKSDVKSAFLDILNLLISQNDENALELRDQIIQSTASMHD